MMIAKAIYILCAATSLVAAVLLLRQYRARRTPLLLWSFVAFLGLAVNHVLVYVDLVLMPGTSVVVPRTLAGAAAMLALLYGLVWETRE